jgi:rhodanese-related sulfurtransferase
MPQYIEFATNHPYLFMALIVVLALIVKTEIESRLSGVAQTSALEAVRLMDEDGMLILDVREASEYSAGHLRQALHIPLSALKSRMAELEKYKNKTVLAYCRSGNRSNTACRQLKKAGFEKAHNLAGGVIAWGNANLPLTKK